MLRKTGPIPKPCFPQLEVPSSPPALAVVQEWTRTHLRKQLSQLILSCGWNPGSALAPAAQAPASRVSPEARWCQLG